MNKIQIISLSIILSLRTFAQLFSSLTANAEDGIHQIDDPIINAYVSELNVKSELFKIRNYGYGGGINGIDENDKYYKEYLNRCSNVEAVDSPFERFRGAAQAGYCVGMSVLSILSHNGIITPNDISSGANYIYDIELDDDVLSSILAYQTQQLNPHFLHYMNWSLAHYTNEEKVDILLKIAERSAKKGEYFLIVADAKNFSHAMAGLGIVDGEWEFNGVKYDKFIPCYDCNAMVEDKETSTLYASGFSADGSIFINSKTKETYMHFYYNIGKCDGLSFFACDDYDLMNYKGKINPSDSYISKTSNIERIDLSKKSECSLTVEREDGSIYDGISSRNKVFKSENGNVYFCDGSKFNVINEAHENELSVNFYNIKNAAFSSFNGMVKNIEKTEKYFGFNVDEETTYDVKLVFEKDYYNFAPHYKFELSGASEISLNNEVDKIIVSYNALQTFTKFNSYEKYLIYSQSYNEQIDSLIETAESCMNENKYFLITFHDESFAHALCGIGIADGEWKWNGKKYDKCILTLDSNAKNTEGNATGFSNERCIYINSETKESYLPAYDSVLKQFPSYSVIADEKLLNYRGMINPTELDSDMYNITQFSYNTTKNTKIYSIKDGLSTLNQESLFSDVIGSAAFLTDRKIHIELENEHKKFPNFRYINADRWIDFSFKSEVYMEYAEYNGTVDIEDNLIAIENKSDEAVITYIQLRMNDDTYGFSPYYIWSVDGNISKIFSAEIVENGILLKSNDRIDMTVLPERYILNNDGKLQYTPFSVVTSYCSPEHNYCYINSVNNVLVTIDDTDKIVCYIDDNNDEIYDVEVVKGDANYDGAIDASDASTVLEHYAKLSTSSQCIPTDYYTMDFNEDSAVDSVLEAAA